MECQDEDTRQSYFVVYPAPESRAFNPFGQSGRSNVLSTNWISDNLILTQFQYKDIKRSFWGKAEVKKEEKYWSVVDQTGKRKAMPLKVENDCSVIYQGQLDLGTMIVLNEILDYSVYLLSVFLLLMIESIYIKVLDSTLIITMTV